MVHTKKEKLSRRLDRWVYDNSGKLLLVPAVVGAGEIAVGNVAEGESLLLVSAMPLGFAGATRLAKYQRDREAMKKKSKR